MLYLTSPCLLYPDHQYRKLIVNSVNVFYFTGNNQFPKWYFLLADLKIWLTCIEKNYSLVKGLNGTFSQTQGVIYWPYCYSVSIVHNKELTLKLPLLFLNDLFCFWNKVSFAQVGFKLPIHPRNLKNFLILLFPPGITSVKSITWCMDWWGSKSNSGHSC